jgi:hypothetical protein
MQLSYYLVFPATVATAYWVYNNERGKRYRPSASSEFHKRTIDEGPVKQRMISHIHGESSDYFSHEKR